MKNTENNYRMTQGEISLLCYKLFMLADAGVNIDDAVSDISESSENKKEKEILDDIKNRLWEGKPLSSAVKSTGAFPDYMSEMIGIGEISGRLTEVFASLAKYYENEEELCANLKRAVVYPSIMAGLVAVVFFILIGKVLPIFSQVFDKMGITLSPLSEAMLSLSGVSEYIAAALVILLAAGTVFIVYNFYIKDGAESFSKLFSKSRACMEVDRSRFASSMAMSLSSGLPIEQAMDMTEELLKGSAIEDKIKDCQELIARGEPFSSAVKQSGIFDSMQSGILSAGTGAGTPDRAMGLIAGKCREEADAGMSAMLGRFEYILVIILCVSVGFVLLSVMLPLLGVITSAGI